MKRGKIINILVICIVVLSLFASAYGIFSKGGPGKHNVKAINGQVVTIYGEGLYKNDSVSMASQGIAQDIVTLLMGIPLLLISLSISNKGLIKGRLLLTGTLAYFLYTYTSYSFLAMYNPMFIIYVILISTSFFAFTLMMMSFDMKSLSSHFDNKLPVKAIGGFILFLSIAVALMWLKRILPSIFGGGDGIPVGIEHYTTLPIQALDLGFVLPTAVLSAILLMKRRPFGYLLSSVFMIKFITMLTAITAMIISQAMSGVKMSITEVIIFPTLNILIIYPLYMILKNIKEIDLNRSSIRSRQ
jgi:hypothetical protein